MDSMKAITITRSNQEMLGGRFLVEKDDWPEVLPIGGILVTAFGNDDYFDILTEDNFTELFNQGQTIGNGFVACELK